MEDDFCCRALEHTYGLEYKDAKHVIATLIGRPFTEPKLKFPD